MLLPQTSLARRVGIVGVLGTLFLFFASLSWRPYHVQGLLGSVSIPNVTNSSKGIVFDIHAPMKIGCEGVVDDLRLRLIDGYSQTLKGVRYANLWGYLGEAGRVWVFGLITWLIGRQKLRIKEMLQFGLLSRCC
jgi:hypothetical protein